MIQPILQVPDQRLRWKSLEVRLPLERTDRAIAGDLLDTMRKVRGAGMSAIQIGHAVRIVALNSRYAGGFSIMINPEIIARSPERVTGQEGCFSIDNGDPRSRFTVSRHLWVDVRFHDRGEQQQVVRFGKLSAAIVQHEIDHLDGKLIWWPA